VARLYLHCVICSRKQADGLLSGAAWGRLELPPGAEIHHPALSGRAFRACPTCMGKDPLWQERVLESFGVATFGQLPESA
jgi:hypothetical protein